MARRKQRARSAGKLLGDVECRRLVFVDGAFVRDLSELDGLEPGLSIRPMAEALAAGDPLIDAHLGKVIRAERDVALALNTAFMGDGALIRIAAGAMLDRPLHLLFVTAADKPVSVFSRSLAVIEKGARAMLIESHETIGHDGQSEHRARTGRRRRSACRPRQADRGGGANPARLDFDGGDRRPCPFQ